ncbi:hypothetical protein AC579_2771 [Pseudocercospora musae]|uniref:Uncharacterized protein n=1 Tax=Pseudocercospora musae TaxID=113226 RepID=A0A139IIH2_9PEZI|nr:hypothetical protein AC579_2771 [Pseudocercospora musae]
MYSIGSKQTSSEPECRARPFGKLRIDTQFTSNGPLPSESRVPELSFVSFEESKARKNATTKKQSLRQLLGGLTPISTGPRQAILHIKGSNGSVRSRKGVVSAQPDQQALVPPAGKRIRGLRPKPLVLNQDVSPSDRAIPIGISVSPSIISNDTTPQSSLLWARSPAQVQGTGPSRYNHDSRGINTPMIVITPAKNRFSPQDESQVKNVRPASSVYSRNTQQYPRPNTTATPPMPPLPLFFNECNLRSRFSDFTRNSATTFFEDAAPSTVAHQDAVSQSKRSTAGLPTPRRSRGWWNIITSPFSAKSSGHGTFFCRSPSTSEHDVERVPVLQHAAEMAHVDSHGGAMFLNRASDDDGLRSAPGECSHVANAGILGRHLPTRSVTAPGALDANAPKLNIYTIPKTGEAASYYNPNRNFPSLDLSGNRDISGDLQGWSPSQSVFNPGHGPTLSASRMTHTPTVMEAALEAEEAFEVEQRNLPRAPSTPLVRGVLFSTPSAEELKTPPSTMKSQDRRQPQTPMDSTLSPLSATPKIQDAHVAQFVALQRKIEDEPAPAERELGLAAATMAHSDEESQPEKPRSRPARVRQDSHGLGITSEQELFPPPVHLSEKPRLGTDRFGQLTIRSCEVEVSARPWYRRFFWLLATSFGIALLILVVLLVVFIPQNHSDIAVQATWLNLTGFPAIAVGISTVIQAQKTRDTDSCVSPSALWSCAAPGPSSGSIPKFRLEIRFRNGTLPHNETELASATTNPAKRWQDGSRLHRFVKRSSWSSSLYSANPSPPSEADQNFLGRTTDNVTEPYNGEETPFYLSLLDTAAIPESTLRKRDSDWTYPYPDRSGQESSAKNASTSAPNQVPPAAATKSKGEPVEDALYPLVSAQHLRLYNRGQGSEHYGFYSYFDRTIYTSGSGDTSRVNNTDTSITGNVALRDASAVCTFSQTRLLVQIWTKKGTVTSLNASGPDVVASNASANNMSAPGSFPLPITITIDRHGGVADKKGVYCYGLDEGHRVMSNVKTWIDEKRGSSLVNAATVPASDEESVQKRDGDQTDFGIDGGSGGCDCQYENWSG